MTILDLFWARSFYSDLLQPMPECTRQPVQSSFFQTSTADRNTRQHSLSIRLVLAPSPIFVTGTRCSMMMNGMLMMAASGMNSPSYAASSLGVWQRDCCQPVSTAHERMRSQRMSRIAFSKQLLGGNCKWRKLFRWHILNYLLKIYETLEMSFSIISLDGIIT